MSEYYNPHRTRNVYNPRLHGGQARLIGGQAGIEEPFKLSRSKIDLFLNCARCFYYDRCLGIARPSGFPFNLNSAVDTLLKKEFDIHRANNKVHPLLKKYGIDARPVAHEQLDEWRENFKGIRYLHKPTNLLITGAIDDLWARGAPTPSNSPSGRGREELEYIVVDYKATSKDEEIIALDKDWQIGYKRQMEVYQWLLRQNGYQVSDTGYFVYCNGKTDRAAFDGKLEFDITLIAYTGNDDWVEPTIIKAHKCLNSDKIPKAGDDCDYCSYVQAVSGK